MNTERNKEIVTNLIKISSELLNESDSSDDERDWIWSRKY